MNPAPLKRVVLCADDFAVHEAASEGIARLAHMGRISATSAMVLSPRWGQDAPLLHDLRGTIDVGLHLDWTSEFAVKAGHGLSLGRAMLTSVLGGFNQQSARGVIERQLDAFEAEWKAPPDHVDGHQHVQQFAGIREALVTALALRYPDRKPYLRVSRAPAGQADFKSRTIAAMGANAIDKIATYACLTGTAALSGIYDFSGTAERYGQRGSREVILPFNYANTDNKYRYLRIREMGGGVDTIVGQDRELALNLLPGEARFFSS